MITTAATPAPVPPPAWVGWYLDPQGTWHRACAGHDRESCASALAAVVNGLPRRPADTVVVWRDADPNRDPPPVLTSGQRFGLVGWDRTFARAGQRA